MSLGYFRKRGQDEVSCPSLTVLYDRSWDDFIKSAERGCTFCAIVSQGFLLFQFVDWNMRVELLLDPNSPAELHASVGKHLQEIVEIYPCPCKSSPH